VTLQAAFAAISVARAPREVVLRVLEATRDALGFERAAFFGSDRNLQVYLDDRDLGGPPELDGPLELLETQSSLAGPSGELCRPTVDVRNWYVLAALRAHAECLGYLFADGHASRTPPPTLVERVEALAAVSAPALQNSLAFDRTSALAARDPLTGLLNRRSFRERFEREIEACRARLTGCACVMIDLDDLKRINDTGGHALGDAVLRQVASALTSSARPSDLIARLGGDEFTLVFRDVDAPLARELLRRLGAALRAAGLRCSLGAAYFGTHGDDVDALLRAADRALYAVKAAGKNGYAFASEPSG
jgi:diguanylate cyclase (GGDEF)-like protein